VKGVNIMSGLVTAITCLSTKISDTAMGHEEKTHYWAWYAQISQALLLLQTIEAVKVVLRKKEQLHSN
jgi:hypothetical protein